MWQAMNAMMGAPTITRAASDVHTGDANDCRDQGTAQEEDPLPPGPQTALSN